MATLLTPSKNPAIRALNMNKKGGPKANASRAGGRLGLGLLGLKGGVSKPGRNFVTAAGKLAGGVGGRSH